jgi:hypothetical protein
MNRQKFKPSVPGKPGVSSIEKHQRRGEIEHDIAVGVQRARLLLCQDKAIALEDLSAIARLSSQIHTNLELVGKYLGEFARHSVQTNISIVVQPEYLKLRSALLQALWPFPEARQAVAAVLHDIEGSAAQEPVPNGHDKVPAVIDAEPLEASNA